MHDDFPPGEIHDLPATGHPKQETEQDHAEAMMLLQSLLDHPRVYQVTFYRMVRLYCAVAQLKAHHAMGPMQRSLLIRRRTHARSIPGQRIEAMGETPAIAAATLAATIRNLDERRRT